MITYFADFYIVDLNCFSVRFSVQDGSNNYTYNPCNTFSIKDTSCTNVAVSTFKSLL